MKKNKLILTTEQFKKLCEGEEFSYLDDLSSKPDMGDIYSTEITTDGAIDNGYPTPTTTDDKAKEMVNNWRGNAKLSGMGAVTIREMSKSDWLTENIFNEESEHGNARLKNKIFGASNGQQGKSYDATKMAISRKNKAEEKLNNIDPEIQAQGAETLKKMHKNWDGLDIADSQYSAAKVSDKISQNNKPEGTKIKSSPKMSGNGKGHSNKNGVFLN